MFGSFVQTDFIAPENYAPENYLVAISHAAELAKVPEIYVLSGAVYRSFLNNRFGPPQHSTDLDLSVPGSAEQVATVAKSVAELCPKRRWAVKPWSDFLSANGIVDVSTTVEDVWKHIPYVWRRCRLVVGPSGLIRADIDERAKKELEAGILSLDEALLSYGHPGACLGILRTGVALAHKLLGDYPGVELRGILATCYEEEYGSSHTPTEIIDPQVIPGTVQDVEFAHGGRKEWTGLLKQEVKHAERVIEFYARAARAPEAIPCSAFQPGEFPKLLKGFSKKGKIPPPPPENFNSWLAYCASNCTDSEWKEWLLNQVRSRTPVSGKDEWLEGVFSYRLVEPYLPKKREEIAGRQKTTHLGWPLWKHLFWSAMLIETDQLAKCVGGVTPEDTRVALRLSMLCHDLGKLVNCDTAGAHESWGAKIFPRICPAWVSEPAKKLAVWAIENHDLYGRLARSLSEKKSFTIHDRSFRVTDWPSYRAAIDPQTARKHLLELDLALQTSARICRHVWEADVGSVPSLRWILPMALPLENVILAGA